MFNKLRPWLRTSYVFKFMNIFISHSWKYSNDYDRIKQFLIDNDVDFRDYSVPYTDPIPTFGTKAQRDKQLWDQLDTQIKLCSCVLIPTGVYASHSDSIKKEVEIAQSYNKPIIAIRRWAAEEESTIVVNAATYHVNWNGKSIANAVIEACE